MAGVATGRVSPFGHPGITALVQLPQAYRSLSRPSSPLDAKASTVCLIAFDLKFDRGAAPRVGDCASVLIPHTRFVLANEPIIHPSIVKELDQIPTRHTWQRFRIGQKEVNVS
jgi:hypothetical protein